jgi:hypothetical protein
LFWVLSSVYGGDLTDQEEATCLTRGNVEEQTLYENIHKLIAGSVAERRHGSLSFLREYIQDIKSCTYYSKKIAVLRCLEAIICYISAEGNIFDLMDSTDINSPMQMQLSDDEQSQIVTELRAGGFAHEIYDLITPYFSSVNIDGMLKLVRESNSEHSFIKFLILKKIISSPEFKAYSNQEDVYMMFYEYFVRGPINRFNELMLLANNLREYEYYKMRRDGLILQLKSYELPVGMQNWDDFINKVLETASFVAKGLVYKSRDKFDEGGFTRGHIWI